MSTPGSTDRRVVRVCVGPRAYRAPMTSTREAFLIAADSTARLLAEPAVAAKWEAPSALTGLSVGGLAGHLAGNVLATDGALAMEAPPELERVTLLEHYARSLWVGAPLDAEPNVNIREGGERTGAVGPAALTAQVADALARLRATLPGRPADRPTAMPWWQWCMALDDVLMVRMLEIAVHTDDLAVSVGIATPELPDQVIDPVLDLLARLSRRRHGAIALLRAYSRGERTPATISAFE
jgi:mycothiol maleylpyruvate isomerase-like protein